VKSIEEESTFADSFTENPYAGFIDTDKAERGNVKRREDGF